MDANQMADALEQAAAAAEYLGGQAEADDVNQSAVTSREDAVVMKRWAHLYRALAG